MILNRLFFGVVITITVIYHSVQVNGCSRGIIEKFDVEFDKAIDLRTGFDYCKLEDLHKLKLEKLMRILQVKEMPKTNTIFKSIDLFYCDLSCGNVHLINNYYKFRNLNGDVYLSETITGRMLASLFKVNKTIYAKPFWFVHMLTLHNSRFRNVTDKNQFYFIEEAEKLTKKELMNHINNICRGDNQHEMIVEDDNKDSDKTDKLREIIAIIEHTQEQNDILFGKETERQWASLKSIYLQKLIENENILGTIIKKFGDQHENSYSAIREDLQSSYTAARNYYYIDNWVIKLRSYHLKVLTILRTVAFHLIKKHLHYADNYWKLKTKPLSSNVVKDIHSKFKDYILDNNFFKKIFESDDTGVVKMLGKLFKKHKISNGVNVTHYELISDIETIMKKMFPKFVKVDNRHLFTADHFDKIIMENQKLMNNVHLLNTEDSNKIDDIKAVIDDVSVSDNMVRIILYLRYLETTFEEYNIDTVLTFVQSFSGFKINYRQRPDQQVDIEI